MVGSDCSFIRCRSRLTNTAATRERSSGRAGFLLDDRGERHQRFRRLHRHVGAAPIPDLLQHAARAPAACAGSPARASCRAGNCRSPAAACLLCGISRILPARKSTSASRATICSEVSPSGIVKACCTTLPSTIVSIVSRKADLLGELVLAVFQVLARLEHQHAADEHPRLVDDVLARQQVGDVAQAEPARNVDDLLALERARAPRTCCLPNE